MAQFGVVQYTSVQSAASVALTTAGITTTSGNLLVAIPTTFTDKIGTASCITDSNSNTWATGRAKSGAGGYVAIFYAENITGGAAHTVTFTPTGSVECGLVVIEISGAATSSSLNGATDTTAVATTHSSGNITSGATAEIFVGAGAVSSSGSGTPTTVAKWLKIAALPDGSPEGIVVATRLVDPATTDQFQFTTSESRTEPCAVVGFKSATSASAGASSYAFIG